MDASTLTVVAAGIAVGIGFAAAIGFVRQRPRAAARSRHPSGTAALSVSLARLGETSHWRVDVPAGRPVTCLDIVTYRRTGGAVNPGEWESEQIVAPIEIRPGGWALLPSDVAEPDGRYELVIAWTARLPDGDVTGTSSFVVDGGLTLVPAPVGRSARSMLATGLVIFALLGAAGVLVAWQLVVGPGDGEAAPPSPAPPTVTSTGASGIAPSNPWSSPAPPTATTTDVTGASPSSPSTIAAATSVAPSVVPTPTAAASTVVASSSPATTTVDPDAPAVLIAGRIEPCRFGSECLVAGFEIVGFDSQPDQYTCEFSDLSVATFRFGGSGVTTACAQAAAGASITVEVDGVRSDTITRDSVDAVAGG